MAEVIALGAGPRVFLVELPGPAAVGFPWAAGTGAAADRRTFVRPEDVPDEIVRRLKALPPATRSLAAGGPLVAALAARTGRRIGLAPLATVRAARSRVAFPSGEEERAFVRAVAERRWTTTLSSPEEIVISLAREEERVERALGREERAAEAFLAVPGSPLEGYAREWRSTRDALAARHARLVSVLEAEATALLPNLARVVGPRVAARLLAAAGGRNALGRLRAPRLQLLGSRRRPSPDRGPRFGLLFRAERMGEVPIGRQGAYARTLAALAAIGARADTTTHRDISDALVRRRDRRVEELSRRRR